MSPDTRPRCEHLVVYPSENCTDCMQAELEALRREVLAARREADARSVGGRPWISSIKGYDDIRAENEAAGYPKDTET